MPLRRYSSALLPVRRRVRAVTLTAAMIAGMGLSAPTVSAETRVISVSGPAVADSYLVVFNSDPFGVSAMSAAEVESTSDRLARRYNVGRGYAYTAALHGFQARMSPEKAAALSRDPRVAYVQQDGVRSLIPEESGMTGPTPTGTSTPTRSTTATSTPGPTTTGKTTSSTTTTSAPTKTSSSSSTSPKPTPPKPDPGGKTQENPPSWGQDRVDQQKLPLDKKYTYPNQGEGVTAYIVDTGIKLSHKDFGERAALGTDSIGDGKDGDDCHGHGTHVAGTVGGEKHGLAKAAKLVAVRVLSCEGSGSDAGIAKGIDWIVKDVSSGKKPAVANMSLGGNGDSPVMNAAVRNGIKAGVVFALASGNSKADACNFSPAKISEAITVNATSENDARAGFSNFGKCTDIFAPGDKIVSDSNKGDDTTTTMSGTSMAAPHVAGAAAIYLSANKDATPEQVAKALIDAAATDVVTNPGADTPNKLLQITAK